MTDQAKHDTPDLPQQAGDAGDMPDLPPSTQLESVGIQLARRRQELGWTVEHVAGRLNLAPRQIDALESDNLAALPGLASTRGFVRAYAKLLRVDAAPLVAALTQDAGPQEEAIPLRRPISTTPFAPVKLAPMKRGGSNKWLWALLAALGVALVAGGAWQAGLLNKLGTDSPSAAASGAPAASASAPGAASAGSAPGSGGDAPAAAAVGSDSAASAGAVPAASSSTPGTPEGGAPQIPPASGAAAPASATAAAPAAGATTAGTAATPPATAPGAPSAAATAPTVTVDAADSGKGQASARALVIKVNQECWIEVKRGDKPIVTRTLQPGTTETVDVASGVVVTVGNVHGVDLTLGGKPLDVRSRARNNVVRIDLK